MTQRKDGRASLKMGGERSGVGEGWEREKRSLNSADDGGEVEDDAGGRRSVREKSHSKEERSSVGWGKRESRGRSRECSDEEEEEDDDILQSAVERGSAKVRDRETGETSGKEAEEKRRRSTMGRVIVREKVKERDRDWCRERDPERDRHMDKDREREKDRRDREREKVREREGSACSAAKRSKDRESRDKREPEPLEMSKGGSRQLQGRDSMEHHDEDVSGKRSDDGANGCTPVEMSSGHRLLDKDRTDRWAEFAEKKPVEKDAHGSLLKHETEGQDGIDKSQQLSGEKRSRRVRCQPRRSDSEEEDEEEDYGNSGAREREKCGDGGHKGHIKRRKEKRRRRTSSSEESEYTSSRDSSEESDSESTRGSESYSSASDSESDSEEERERERERKRRRRKEKEKRKEKERKKEKEREKRRREKKRRKEKKEKQERKAMKKKELEKEKGSMRGAVTAQWGQHGLIKEIDMWKKRPEFSAWLAEVKKMNLETLTNWEEKNMFKEYMEDYNTATLPSMKYYSLDAFHREEMKKAHAMGMAMVKSKERTAFNDEDERRQEIRRQREREKEAEIQALKRAMQGGLAQAMREQERLREEMQYQYRVGNFEAASAIQKRLEPDQLGKF